MDEIVVIIGVIWACLLCIFAGYYMASDIKETQYKEVIDENNELRQANKDLMGKIAELSKDNYYNYKKEWRV
jgi:H+/gluconate symporter-like permease